MTAPDFEKLAEQLWDGAAVDAKPTWQYLFEAERVSHRALIRATWNAAIEEAAGAVDANASDIMDGASGEWLAGKVRAMKALTTEKEG